MGCPSADEMLAFVARALSPVEIEPIAAHVESCRVCRDMVLTLARDRREVTAAATTLDGNEPAAPSLAPGATIGRYVISRLLGIGGMGVVYAGWDPHLERQVAVKLLRPDATVPAELLRARLFREAQAMARLSHPAVITVHEVGTHRDDVFVAMELVDGGTLAQWLRAERRSWRDIVRVFCAAGEGLSAAHAAGLVHRDFKPDNVLVWRDGRVCVTDFGLARSVDLDGDEPVAPSSELALNQRLTRTGAVVGTPAYMAPEQLMSNRCDARSDLFSFCVALYEALFGARPFDGANVAELRASITRGAVEPRGGGVPAWIRRAVLRGLSADPAARPATMAELLHSLRVDPLARRRRQLWLGLALVALAVPATALVKLSRRAHGWQPVTVDRRPIYEEDGGTPVFSPDGKWLVYDSTRDGSWRMYREPAGGGEAVPLTPPGWGVWLPKWTSDSRAILFEDNINAYRISIDGGERTLIVPHASYVVDCAGRIAYVIAYLPGCPGCQRLMIREPAGERELFRVKRHIVTPNCDRAGQRIAFTILDDWGGAPGGRTGDIYVVDTAGGAPLRLTDDGVNAEPVFNPDGKRVVFSATHDGIVNLWEQPLAGGRAEQLTFDEGEDADADISPDGQQLIYSFDQASHLVVAHPTDGGAPRRVSHAVERVESLVVPADGKEIIAGVRRGTARYVVSIGLPDGDERVLTDGYLPALTADEERIVLARSDGGATDLFTLSRAGGTPRRLGRVSFNVVSLSVDAEYVHVAHDAGVQRVSLASGAVAPELPENWVAEWVAPRGGYRLLWGIQEKTPLYLLAPGAPPATARRLPMPANASPLWRGDGRAFYYWDGAAVRSYDLDGHDEKLLDVQLARALGVSADGKTVYTVEPFSHSRRRVVTNYGQRPR